MKIRTKLTVFALVAGFVSSAQAEPPHIGYAYPSGGRQGSTFRVMIGGQHLQGSTNVFVSGEGVKVKIVKHTVKYEPRRLRQLFRNKENALAAIKGKKGVELEKLQRRIDLSDKQLSIAELPEGMDFNDKRKVTNLYKIDSKEQFNPQIADRLRVDISGSRGAAASETRRF